MLYNQEMPFKKGCQKLYVRFTTKFDNRKKVSNIKVKVK